MRQVALFLLLALVIYPVPGFVTLPNPQTARSLHVIPLVALIAAVGICTIADLISNLARRVSLRQNVVIIPVAITLALGVFGAEASVQLREYFRDYAKQGQVLVVLHR